MRSNLVLSLLALSVGCATSGVPFAISSLTMANNDKCTSSVIAGTSEVSIHTVRLSTTCASPTGECSQDFWWPLETAATGCANVGPYDQATAKAYLTGWKVNTPNSVASQLQRLRVWVESLPPASRGGIQGLPFRVSFIAQSQGTPAIISQDANELELVVEIIAIASKSSLSLSDWTQTAGGAGAAVNSSQAFPGPAQLGFAALSGFDIQTAVGGSTGAGVRGVNLTRLGVETESIGAPAGGFATALRCTLEGDAPPTSQTTVCATSLIALIGSSPNVARAVNQPAGHFPPPFFVDNSLPSFSFPVGGASGVSGHPSCGLSAFGFSILPTPFTSAGGTAIVATSIKEKRLGYVVSDCDTQLLSSGQQGTAYLGGWFVLDPVTAASDQHASLSSPPPPHPQFEFHSMDLSSIPLRWSGSFRMDSVALR